RSSRSTPKEKAAIIPRCDVPYTWIQPKGNTIAIVNSADVDTAGKRFVFDVLIAPAGAASGPVSRGTQSVPRVHCSHDPSKRFRRIAGARELIVLLVAKKRGADEGKTEGDLTLLQKKAFADLVAPYESFR